MSLLLITNPSLKGSLSIDIKMIKHFSQNQVRKFFPKDAIDFVNPPASADVGTSKVLATLSLHSK